MNKKETETLESLYTDEMTGIDFTYDGYTYRFLGDKTQCKDLMMLVENKAFIIKYIAEGKGLKAVLKELDSIKKYLMKDYGETDEKNLIDDIVRGKHEEGFVSGMLFGWITMIIYLHSYELDNSVAVDFIYSCVT